MIYLVTGQQELFLSDVYKVITVEESLAMISSWDRAQYDSETSCLDCHVGKMLCIQIGNKKANIQIVIDAETVDITRYKNFLEKTFLIGHNIAFDLKWLYNYGIIPRRTWDTMIAEKALHLGYPSYISNSLAAVAKRRLNIDIDKSIRGQIIWRGLDTQVIQYAANDVVYLEDIMEQQIEEANKYGCLEGVKNECLAVPAIAYLEWCGIHLDAEKWEAKMDNDQRNLAEATKLLNEYFISLRSKYPQFNKYVLIDTQGDLFAGFNTTPRCTLNWNSGQQVVQVAKTLGFDTSSKNKQTGEDTDSVLEKVLKIQKGIDDKFLELYFNYKEYGKVVSTYGQGHLNAINPKTGRLHTSWHQIGASSGRMSCGDASGNADLAKLKGLKQKEVVLCNLQQLPGNEETRSCFTAMPGNQFVSCDFSAEESRLGADIYKDKEMLKEFLEGSGDMHSLFAWMVFRNECEALGCTNVADVKTKAPKWRKAVKAVEFSWMFGAAAQAISTNANCTVEEAQQYLDNLEKGFSGVAAFAKKGSAFVRKNGYIIIEPITGLRLWWYDHKEWLDEEAEFKQPGFWDDYRLYHKGTDDAVAQKVRMHMKSASKWDRLARNVVTQGCGAIIMKHAVRRLFDWIVEHGLFNKVKICALVHDEINCEYPESLSDFPMILEKIMESTAAIYCKSLPVPAEAAVGDHWIH